MLVGPDDVKNYRKIIYTLNRSKYNIQITSKYKFLFAMEGVHPSIFF